MTYTQFLKVSEDNKFIICLTLDGEYLSFIVDNCKDLNNVKSYNWDKVNFNHFKGAKLIKAYNTTKK